MTTALATDLRASAESVMRRNDTGSYSVPSRATYPHQWNWDSALARRSVASAVVTCSFYSRGSRRPSLSKRMIRQPSSRATRSSTRSGFTATGWPTVRIIGRSDSESE